MQGYIKVQVHNKRMDMVATIIYLSSFGSRLALWSGPSIFLSKVKCFSITLAPRATAAIGTSIPRVWSE